MKKKLAAFLLTALLSVGMALSALAAENGDKITIVKTTVPVKYTVTIPQTIDVTFNTVDTDFSIAVTDAMLDPQGKITVTAAAAGSMINSYDGNSKLAYTIKDDTGADFTGIAFTGNGSKTCKVNITQTEWNMAVAGDYSGSTTFTVTYDSGRK